MTDVINNAESNRYELHMEGQVAVADYVMQGDKMLITHVGVPKQLENRGLGSKIVKFALDEAKEKNLKVAPLCSFAAAYIQRHKEYQELL